jgi:hypothetical protein
MDAQTRLEPKVKEFIDTVQQLMNRIEGATPGQPRPTLRTVEQELQKAASTLAHEATTSVVATYGTGRQGNQRPCPCGGTQRFKALHEKEVLDLHGGAMVLSRAYYDCRQCERGFVPLDEELGLARHEMTPALADIVELMGVVCPFESAVKLLKRTLNVDVSDDRVRRATEQMGQRCLDADEAEAIRAISSSVPLGATDTTRDERHYMMPDGGMVPTLEGYREAKLGVCFRASDHIQVSEKRSILLRKRFFGDIATAEEFGKRLYATAQREGIASDGKGCDVVGDGAPWIWNLKAEHLPAAGENVDWYHAKEHIFATAHALYGEGTAKATSWAETRADELWKEQTPKVLGALRRTRPTRDPARQSVADLTRYVTENQCRMKYLSRRENGLLVGSGPIEGGISYVMQDRLKRTGMHWDLQGARQVLALRLRWVNDEWDQPGARPAAA